MTAGIQRETTLAGYVRNRFWSAPRLPTDRRSPRADLPDLFLLFLLMFLGDPCLHQLFHRSVRQRLLRLEVDGAFRYVEAPELVLEHFDYGITHREQTAVL